MTSVNLPAARSLRGGHRSSATSTRPSSRSIALLRGYTVVPSLPPRPETGHIPGTSHRDSSRTDEKRRDLSRRSDHMYTTFAMVKDMPAQDPAYRPTRPRPKD